MQPFLSRTPNRSFVRTFVDVILPVVVSQDAVLQSLEVIFRDRLQPRRVLKAVVERRLESDRLRDLSRLAFEIGLTTEQAREACELVRASNGGVRDIPQLRVVFRAVFAFLDGLGKVKLGLFEDTKSSGRKSEREAARQVLERARAGGAGRRVLEREI